MRDRRATPVSALRRHLATRHDGRGGRGRRVPETTRGAVCGRGSAARPRHSPPGQSPVRVGRLRVFDRFAGRASKKGAVNPSARARARRRVVSTMSDDDGRLLGGYARVARSLVPAATAAEALGARRRREDPTPCSAAARVRGRVAELERQLSGGSTSSWGRHEHDAARAYVVDGGAAAPEGSARGRRSSRRRCCSSRRHIWPVSAPRPRPASPNCSSAPRNAGRASLDSENATRSTRATRHRLRDSHSTRRRRPFRNAGALRADIEPPARRGLSQKPARAARARLLQRRARTPRRGARSRCARARRGGAPVRRVLLARARGGRGGIAARARARALTLERVGCARSRAARARRAARAGPHPLERRARLAHARGRDARARGERPMRASIVRAAVSARARRPARGEARAPGAGALSARGAIARRPPRIRAAAAAPRRGRGGPLA